MVFSFAIATTHSIDFFDKHPSRKNILLLSTIWNNDSFLLRVSMIYIPPLYLPKNCRQFGHLWVTELSASMQHGTHAHGHNLWYKIKKIIYGREPKSKSFYNMIVIFCITMLWFKTYPTTHNIPASIQASAPGSDSVDVRTWLWQCGHIISIELGPIA